MKQARNGRGQHRSAWLGTILVASLFLLCRPAAALAPGDVIYADTILTSDIVDHTFSGTVITIGADNITLDGAGYRIDTPNAGIVVDTGGHTGITIRNLSASGSAAGGVGILVWGPATTISDVDVSGAGNGAGVQVEGSDIVLERVRARQRATGISFGTGDQQGNVVSGCDCSGSQYGIFSVYGAHRLFTFTNNDFRNCTQWGMYLGSFYDTDVGGDNLLTGCANGIDLSGSGVRIHDTDVSGDGSGFGVVVQGSGIVLERVRARQRAVGMYLWAVSGAVKGARIEANTVGILVNSSPDVTIHACAIAGNTSQGVQNDSPQTVDARGNWWGSETGPTDTNPPNSLDDGIGPNPGGQGDKVTDYVRYESWIADTTAPTITAAADPTVLWPPNGKKVTVTISGKVSDSGSGVDPSSVAYAVTDDYGMLQPTGSATVSDGGYSFEVSLEARRDGADPDGRHYTVTVSARDRAGNPGSASVVVAVPHDQGR